MLQILACTNWPAPVRNVPLGRYLVLYQLKALHTYRST